MYELYPQPHIPHCNIRPFGNRIHPSSGTPLILLLPCEGTYCNLFLNGTYSVQFNALTGANTGAPSYGSAYLKVDGVQVIYWKYEQHGENKVTNSVFVRKGALIEYGDYVAWWGYRPVSWIVSFYPCE